MKLYKILSAVIAVSMLFTSAYAHSGRTDSSGGHYNHSTGEYHYHHGYPAHQHTDGVCPYDFDDKTGENSGVGGGSAKNNNEEMVILKSEPQPVPAKKDDSGYLFIGYLAAFIIFLAYEAFAPQKRIAWKTKTAEGRKKKNINSKGD